MANKIFTTVPVPRFPRNTFPLSRPVAFTPRLQKIYSPNVIEIIPGDGINERAEAYARSQPLVAPTFGKIDVFQEAFFVPDWQLNEHFDDFITGGERGTYTDKMPYTTVNDLYTSVYTILTPFNFTQFSLTANEYNKLLEKIQSIIEHCDLLRAVPFTLPDFVLATTETLAAVAIANFNAFNSLNSHLSGSSLRVNYLPFGAYLKIWCEFYRDENLCDDEFEDYWKGGKASKSLYSATGQNSIESVIGISLSYSTTLKDDFEEFVNFMYALFGVHDRAWKKDYFTSGLPFTQKGPDVLLPLAGTFPVDFEGNPALDETEGVTVSPKTAGQKPVTLGTDNNQALSASVKLGASGLGATIQDVRTAFRLQEMFEADARFGNRYPENTLGQFGVRTPDSRLPRCQYLGGNSQPVQISEVVQTSAASGQPTPQGNLAGKASTYGSNRLCKTFQTLHGFLFNLATLRVKAMYAAGIAPMFSRYDRTEYAWPRFAHLGEQPIYDKELYVDSYTTEDGVLAYTPRYADYKSAYGTIHGLLKGSLNFWTMARRFASQPQLNEEFIYNHPRQDAWVIDNPLQPPFIMEIDYRVRANRILPYFGIPKI